jgi:hypothetical protein
VSRVGGAREAGFDETRGAEDGFGRGHGAWPARWPTPAANAITARNREERGVSDGGEGSFVIKTKFKTSF